MVDPRILLTDTEERELLTKIKNGSRSAEKRLRTIYQFLIATIAVSYPQEAIGFQELMEIGNRAFEEAVESFIERKLRKEQYRFSIYVEEWIRDNIVRALDNRSGVVKVSVNTAITINKLYGIEKDFQEKFGRRPTPKEIADELGIKVDQVSELFRIAQEEVLKAHKISSKRKK